jgi:hypothetical protein
MVMGNDFTRLTLENYGELLSTMQRLAKRGPVQVEQHCVIGGHPFTDHLTFGTSRVHGMLVIEARTSGGLVMNTPVAPTDLDLRREGDAIAYYCAQNNVVVIRCRLFGLPDSMRTFRFS